MATIDGDFQLKGLTVLSALNMPSITKVGKIDWQTLPALKTLGFGQGITEAGSVRITDTMLSSLEGLKLTSVSTFDINNNKFLKSVEVQLTSVTEALTIAFNGKGVEASFPELKWAKNVTVRDAGLISFPKLEKVNSSIAFVNNTFEDAAFPKLKSAGDFSMISCIKLTNLTANVLEEVEGTFLLANNTKLAKATNFKKLATVLGSIDVSGALTEYVTPCFVLIYRANLASVSSSPFSMTSVVGSTSRPPRSSTAPPSKTSRLGLSRANSSVRARRRLPSLLMVRSAPRAMVPLPILRRRTTMKAPLPALPRTSASPRSLERSHSSCCKFSSRYLFLSIYYPLCHYCLSQQVWIDIGWNFRGGGGLRRT